MIKRVDFEIESLKSMKRYPKELFYLGNMELLQKQKVSIVGSRKPNQYAREMTRILSQKLVHYGVCIVSGGAIGIDAIAHKAAGSKNTIMIAATGLDKRYPAINKSLIADIEDNGLVLSQFKKATPSTRYNFVLRNELVVALGEILIVSYADEKSGTMHSIKYAQKMGKKIYVLPHRMEDSKGTNSLLKEKKAEAIYDIDAFVKTLFGNKKEFQNTAKDEFLLFCQNTPTYDEVLAKYPSRLFEAELSGEIEVVNGRVRVLT